jgi:hypothetical protein
MYKKGYICFPYVTFIEVQKNFFESLNNSHLSKKLFLLDDETFTREFWKYVDDGGYMLGRWYDFLYTEKLKRLIEWCNLNNIKYKR